MKNQPPEYLEWMHPTMAQMKELCIFGDGGKDEFKWMMSVTNLQIRLKVVVDLLRLAIERPEELDPDYTTAICDEVSK